ncbi:hypothetical protein BN137_3667 [Cronobacter condimenti 1330]|uniref:Uncharacterized protein n=1 Tax=Cronobacter condimenti 1330 TaxID=1073999 RepID=K8AEP8_9ENTR|nr:hypothetical protein BN137_3667 [Cronobacter condimenti 1330]
MLFLFPRHLFKTQFYSLLLMIFNAFIAAMMKILSGNCL